jgi:hypothetical protein
MQRTDVVCNNRRRDSLMDEAKVVINVKEGIIELQGAVGFVRHYLDTYRSAIKGSQGLPKDAAF